MRKAKSAHVLALSFLLPALAMLAVYAAMGMAPFGDKSILTMDMSNQYVEFLCGLKSGDLYFSWSKSLGTSYVGVFAYYVSSPLSVLTLFVPNASMPVGVLFLTVLKLGLCGLTFSLFLQHRFGEPRYGNAVFALFYGLTAYNIAYSICIMWLDAVFWLPVILLGLEKVLRGEGRGVLTAALFFSFLSNYYLSYMSGLFTALYFLYRCLEEKLPRQKVVCALRKFALSVLSAAALGAFLLLPTLFSLFQGKLHEKGADYGGVLNFTPSALFIKLLPGGYDSLTNAGAPFLYAGILPFLLFIAFFFQRREDLRSRLLTGAFSLILLASLFLSPLDRVWHIFQYPNWFPYRYAFVLSLFMLLTAYRAYLRLRLPQRPTAAGILLLFCLCDMFFNAFFILKGIDAQFRYESYAAYRSYREEVSGLLAHTEKDGFYRVGATAERSKNEAIGFGYNGITHYSSAFNGRVNRFLSALGFAQGYIWSSYFGSTAVTDALFSVRYILSPHPVSPVYTAVAAGKSLALYMNPDALSVGMAVSGRTLGDFSLGGDPMENQNKLVRALTGIGGDCFREFDVSQTARESGVEYSFVSSGLPVYGCFRGTGRGALFVNGSFVSELFTNETRCIHYLGTFDRGRRVTVRVDAAGLMDGSLRCLDEAVWNDALGRLRASQLEVCRYDSRRLAGSVTAKEGDVLFTTIPYDKGWTAYVDGRKVETAAFADTLMTVPLPAGTHDLLLVYTAPGLVPGILLSLLAALLTAGGAFRRMKKRGR